MGCNEAHTLKEERAAMKQYIHVLNKSSYGSFRIALEPDEVDGGYVAECLDLEGCFSEGDTQESALANIGEAIEGVCESMMEHHGRVMHSTESSDTHSESSEEIYTSTPRTLKYA